MREALYCVVCCNRARVSIDTEAVGIFDCRRFTRFLCCTSSLLRLLVVQRLERERDDEEGLFRFSRATDECDGFAVPERVRVKLISRRRRHLSRRSFGHSPIFRKRERHANRQFQRQRVEIDEAVAKIGLKGRVWPQRNALPVRLVGEIFPTLFSVADERFCS